MTNSFARMLALPLAFALATPALAGEAVLTRPLQAASLHEGTLDMVAYFQPKAAALEVTATFAARSLDGAPVRVVMALADGDAVAFGMPGHPSVLYSFVRKGGSVTLSASAPGSFAVAAR